MSSKFFESGLSTSSVSSIPQIIQTILKVLYSIQHNPIEILDNNTTIKVEYIDSPILFLRLCKEVSTLVSSKVSSTNLIRFDRTDSTKSLNSNIGSILVYCDVLNISNDSNRVSSIDLVKFDRTDSTKLNRSITLKLTNDLIYKSIELGYFKHININLSQSD